ncbi:MAG: hypothetical protein JW952_07345 [Candidatus Eisenbacteria bacterium]|nr:hypothetical protein [Candidatus Eisenbacteria bacterium]
MNLRDWQANRWITEHRTNRLELKDLLAVADRDLADSGVAGLSADARLGLAYSGALQLATAALAVCGYRAARERHHHTVIQSLAYTIAGDSALIAEFDGFRKKRNMSGYERPGCVSDHDAARMKALALRLRGDVGTWLREHHPELLAD